ncbi:uncharacterized protein HD556DRAFT_1230974, partial [Suillus plorans]
GCSCILFCICLFVLLGHHGTSRKMLLFSSVVQFSLATAHVIISLLELIAAFATSASAADNYFADPGANELFVSGFFVYIVNTFAQELLLIWRLYVIWDHNFKICIMPGTICGDILPGIASIAVSGFIPATATPLTRNVHSYGLAGWGLETGVNFLASGGIAYRLWHAGRRTAVLTGRHFNYKASFLIIVECGALITTCTAVMFSLYAANKPKGLVGVGAATQIATTSPLLIIARVGFSMSKRKTISTETTLAVSPSPLQE